MRTHNTTSERIAIVLLTLLVVGALRAEAQKAIDGASASRWTACPGWVSRLPQKYGVTGEGGALVFSAEGAKAEMPWALIFKDDELSGDARYLLVHYKAEGLSAQGGNYFLHGYEGTPGGRLYAWGDEVQPDGAWHTLAVDLAKLRLQEPTVQLAIKVIVDDSGKARLTIDKLWFGDDLPAGARGARALMSESKSTVLDWRKVAPLKPAPGWTTNAATDFSALPEESAIVFTVRGADKQMRWPLTLPQPVDLGQLPYFSLRYKASGQLGLTTYAIWLGDDVTGAGGHSSHPLLAKDLKADGQWHTVSKRLGDNFKATQLAVGLDCAGDEARMTLDSITFSSSPPAWPVRQLLAYDSRTEAWPSGKDGMTVLPSAVTGGKPSSFLAQRLNLSDWFTAENITVGGVPFQVSSDPAQIPQSGTAECGTLQRTLPPGTKEVYLLTAASAPGTEPFGIDPSNPRPIELLSEPEKVVFEIRYVQGPADFVLPVDAETGRWGMKRGLGVCVVHPDPTRQVMELLLHDRMQTAAFAILGTTVRAGTAKVAEPNWDHLKYAPPRRGALASVGKLADSPTDLGVVASGQLGVRFALQPSFRWSGLSAGAAKGLLSCAGGPLFEVSLGGKTLSQETWKLENSTDLGKGLRFTLRNTAAGLLATVDCGPGGNNEVLLRMKLTNEGAKPVTATLRFPVLRGICLGTAKDTWYLCNKRGGIINSTNVNIREPLGDPHPLQVDGFFNPKTGIALACITHDTAAQHHFIRFAKNETGGEWSPEYVERDIAPGESFTTTEASLVLREGDWRAIFGAYRDWLKTWFKPPAAKPWWERTFAFLGSSAYRTDPDPKHRGDLQHLINTAMKHLGVCDYVHLFGWSSSDKYGDWGDYDHYDETVGGLEYFRGNIARAQATGIGVGLYQDGYLNCEKGQFSGAHAKEWAMKRRDGSLNYVPDYDAYNECPYNKGWQQYLTDTYGRIHRDLGTKGLYIDEYGATDGRWICYARDHGHNGYEIPYAGEVEMLKGIRAAVGPDVALYTEYPSAEVSRQILDGSFTYQALWSVDQEPLAPHFVDLPRFAFPEFKQFHIIYYVTPRAGNWWLLKYPFFNGESYDIGEPNLPGYDEPSLAFQRRAVEVLCAHRDAFSSHQVEPLVQTEVAGVFANSFATAKEKVWTVYNANGRSVRAPFLRIRHIPGATYEDAWAGKPLRPEIKGGYASIAVGLGPKAVGCVVQKLQ